MRAYNRKFDQIWFVRKSNLQTGGVEMQMLRQATWFRDHGSYPCRLITDNLDSPLAQLFRKHGFPVDFCMLEGPGYFSKAVRTLLALTRKQENILLQAHMFRESLVCRAVKLFNRKVTHYYRVETYIDCSPIPEPRKRGYHFLAGRSSFLVDRYFANGNLVFDELTSRSGVPRRKIEVVYNGVESFGEPDQRPLIHEADNRISAAFIANLIPGKGHALLFKALEQVNRSTCGFRVYLYGDVLEKIPGQPDFRDHLQELVSQGNLERDVVFCGYTHDLEGALSTVSVVLLPSDTEGTPNSILEAMSIRKLVIVSNAGELGYLVDEGNAGLIHNTRDAAGLERALRVTADPDQSGMLEALRDSGYERWKSLFSLQASMERMEKYYFKSS